MVNQPLNGDRVGGSSKNEPTCECESWHNLYSNVLTCRKAVMCQRLIQWGERRPSCIYLNYLKLTPRSENLFAVQGFQADHASQRPSAVMEQFSLRSFQLALATKIPSGRCSLRHLRRLWWDSSGAGWLRSGSIWFNSLPKSMVSKFPRPPHWTEPTTDVTF